MVQGIVPHKDILKVVDSIVYLFSCPEHGLERTMFCWRATDKEYYDRWAKYIQTLTPVPFAGGEFYRLMNSMGVEAPARPARRSHGTKDNAP